MSHSIRIASAIALLLGAALAIAGEAEAYPYDARALGMGRAGLAVEGAASNAWTTPALLGLPSTHSAIISSLPSVSIGLGNNLLGFRALDELLQGKELAEADAQNLADAIPATGWGFQLDGGLAWGASVPASGLGVFARSTLDTAGLNLPRDLLGLVLRGNAAATAVRIDSLEGARIDSFADGGLSFGMPLTFMRLPNVAVGVTGRYVQGLAFGRITEARGDLLQTNPDGSFSGEASATYQYGTFGSGMALDCSMAVDVRRDLRLAMNVSNLGGVYWGNVTEKRHTYKLDRYAPGLSSDGQFNGSPNVRTEESFGPNNGMGIWDALPMKVGVGGRWLPSVGAPVMLAADVEVGLGKGYGVSTVPEIHLGGEYRVLEWLPLRAGLSVGGESATLYSLGLGFDGAESRIDLAMGAYNGLFSASKGFYYAISSQRKF